jgi:SAM-dependent methyltransferase
MSERFDRHDLYQRAVQTVDVEIDFIDETFRALRGRLPRSIREDFCGTANTSCEFVRRRRGNRAFGVDLCEETLTWGITHNLSKLRPDARSRLELIRGDVRIARTPPVDAVLAMNFSYCIFKDRAGLREYFRHTRRMLRPRGLFFLDAYGGYDAFRVLREPRRIDRNVTYVWHQASYNPINGETLCHIDFRFRDGSAMRKAFTYDWRVWTLPELREVLAEAGFRKSTVYWEGWDERKWEGDGEFKPAEMGEADAGWIAYVVAKK